MIPRDIIVWLTQVSTRASTQPPKDGHHRSLCSCFGFCYHGCHDSSNLSGEICRLDRGKSSGAERCRWIHCEGESGKLVFVLVALIFVKFVSFSGKNDVVLDDNDKR